MCEFCVTCHSTLAHVFEDARCLAHTTTDTRFEHASGDATCRRTERIFVQRGWQPLRCWISRVLCRSTSSSSVRGWVCVWIQLDGRLRGVTLSAMIRASRCHVADASNLVSQFDIGINRHTLTGMRLQIASIDHIVSCGCAAAA